MSRQDTNPKNLSLGDYAASLCWPPVHGDSNPKGKYPSGSKYPEYKRVFDIIKPQNSSRIKDKKFRAGASCDMFVGCAVRGYGITDFPVALARQCDYFFKSDKYKKYFTKVPTSSGLGKVKKGDIIIRINAGSRNNGQGHILIVYEKNGKKYTANAHHRKGPGYYGVIDGFSGKDKNSNPRLNKYWGVFRLKNEAGLDTTTYSSTDTTTIDPETGEAIPVTGMDDGRSLVLQSIDELFSTDRYGWAEQAEEVESEEDRKNRERAQSLRNFLSNISISLESSSGRLSIPDTVVGSASRIKPTSEFRFKPDLYKGKSADSKLISFPNWVEAPYIELSLNGITIGGYNNSGDKYPNYITSMTVSKINGKINRYTINLVYQIRPGEDPNFIDSLLSRTGYTNPLKIKYGDSSSPELIYKEERAVITDVKQSENVSSLSISYTISAISSVLSADQSYFNFSEKKGKPSTILTDTLYNSGVVSTQLQEAFPAMKNQSYVSSNNLIPTNDVEATVGGMANVSPLTYLGHVVSCMTNSSTSSYFLTYGDSREGAYFKVSEVKSASSQTNALYEIDIGYPGDNYVLNFQLCDNLYWPLIYKYNDKIPKWNYSIDNVGNVIASSSNRLLSDNNYMTDSVINSNWWKTITEFPISARVTLKGLTVPVMLMTYIRINTLFYGVRDMASGLYVVTDQEDSISGNGCTTTLTLLRVGE